jgi:hypothetical protein
MANGHLVAAAAALTVILMGVLYTYAVRNPESYRADVFGPVLVASLAGFLTCLVWWLSGHTAYGVLRLHISDPAAAEKLAQVTFPALMLAVSFGLVGIFAWRLPNLIDWLRPGGHRNSAVR